MSGGFKATSICTIRREPGFAPTLDVTARGVNCQTAISAGVWPWHVPSVITTSFVPSKRTCWPSAGRLASLVPEAPRAPIRFCFAVILTHLNGRASVPFTPAVDVMVVPVKELELVSNCPVWLFEPQGPFPGVNPRLYLSQQSWSSRYGFADNVLPAAVVGSRASPLVGFFR